MVFYLDHAASTPVHPAASSAMADAVTQTYGNPSGAHRLAREANRSLDAARATLAEVFGLAPGDIVFTSGGTEADSLAINGALRRSARNGQPSVAVCSAIEHHAVLEPVEDTGGLTVAVDPNGVLDLDDLRRVLHDLRSQGSHIAVVSVMAANNETGVVQPVTDAAAIVGELAPDALFHTDAVQFAAWHDTVEIAASVDLMSVSGHKLGGPKGAGFLSVRTGVDLRSIQLGGGQERGRRGGTQNVPGIVALAAAAEAMSSERAAAVPRVRELRDRLATAILEGVPEAVLTGEGAQRLPNIAHFCLPGIESEPLLFLMEKDDVMASAAA
ncbi:MAG: aminotransferase class V-fold PLP-dependent enzyme, partial [Acidimicrobiia bacterium]|nr:aminotransferase class V-fold PLP-dependent enzyme [Acidimicrobiia bacterium]